MAEHNTSAEAASLLLPALQNDFRILATESKKKFPQLKEVRNRVCLPVCNTAFIRCFSFSYAPQSCEEAIIVLKNATTNNQSLYYIVNQVLYPVIQGCETKDQKIIKVSAVLCTEGHT